jgi:uncharacterized protein (DUF1697 family)
MTLYVALVRGINVGGKNIIRMTELKACFEKLGFQNVRTFIQSGNVLFEASGARTTLATKIEKAIARSFKTKTVVVLRNRSQLRHIVEHAPRGFGKQALKYRYDVIFLKEPLTAAAALKKVPTKEGVDAVFAGRGVLYFSRLESKATQSRLSRVIMLPVYKSMTIRNWSTTSKLLKAMTAKE